MNARALFDEAMTMLGYVNAEGLSGEEDMLKKSLVIINKIYFELYRAFVNKKGDGFIPLGNINDEVNLPQVVLRDIAPYGVAMFLAQSEGDADSQALYANLYNQKKISGSVGKITDRLPHVWG